MVGLDTEIEMLEISGSTFRHSHTFLLCYRRMFLRNENTPNDLYHAGSRQNDANSCFINNIYFLCLIGWVVAGSDKSEIIFTFPNRDL